MRKRNTRWDYRLYHVDGPRRDGPSVWTGRALLRGLPDVEASSQRDLYEQIDDVYERRKYR